MPRGPLSAKQKDAMQAARKVTSAERSAAREAIEGNSQFTNPKFWGSVDPELFADIENAMAKARKAQRSAEIAQLKARLAELEAE